MNNREFEKIQREFFKNLTDNQDSPFLKGLGFYGKIKNYFIKHRKLIYGSTITIILISVITYFMTKEPSGNFKITTPDGVVYNTNNVEMHDGCVFFTRIKNDEKIILCGNFIIETQN